MIFRLLLIFLFILISGPAPGLAADMSLPSCNSAAIQKTALPEKPEKLEKSAFLPIWRATATTFMDGRLIYKDVNTRISPGIKSTTNFSRDLLVSAGNNFQDTVIRFPDTCKTIYDSGLIRNYMEYKIMVGDNWRFARLSANDFADAGRVYAAEGNWGLLQTGYYGLKGTSRVVWALAILNSGEAVYKILQAGGETVYYLLRYPVGGTLKTAGAPVVFVLGTVGSTVVSVVTTGWALPFAAVYDGLVFTGGAVWPE